MNPSKTGRSEFKCLFSEEICNSNAALKNHVYTYHPKMKDNFCDTCNKYFQNKFLLNRHARSHTGEKSYACHICNKRFLRNGSLKVHSRIHTGEKPYSCQECNKRFSYKCVLDKHRRTHTAEKPHACHMCNKRFSRKDSLKLHSRIHTGEKPYSCQECNKRFSDKSCLNKHRRTHTAGKHYTCHICNKRFSKSESLREHLKIHSPDKTYPCDVCTESSSQTDDLNSRPRIHPGEKTPICDICGKHLSDKRQLEYHSTYCNRNNIISLDSGSKLLAMSVMKKKVSRKSIDFCLPEESFQVITESGDLSHYSVYETAQKEALPQYDVEIINTCEDDPYQRAQSFTTRTEIGNIEYGMISFNSVALTEMRFTPVYSENVNLQYDTSFSRSKIPNSVTYVASQGSPSHRVWMANNGLPTNERCFENRSTNTLFNVREAVSEPLKLTQFNNKVLLDERRKKDLHKTCHAESESISANANEKEKWHQCELCNTQHENINYFICHLLYHTITF